MAASRGEEAHRWRRVGGARSPTIPEPAAAQRRRAPALAMGLALGALSGCHLIFGNYLSEPPDAADAGDRDLRAGHRDVTADAGAPDTAASDRSVAADARTSDVAASDRSVAADARTSDVAASDRSAPADAGADAAADAGADAAADAGAPVGRVLQLALGLNHSCARFEHGQVKCWGDGRYGALGNGKPGFIGDEPGEVSGDLPTVALGSDAFVVQIEAGMDHTCARLEDGRVKCWGRNDQGQLGLNHLNSLGDDPNEMGERLPAVVLGVSVRSISCGWAHCCAILDDDRMKCWGRNASGQLGLGDTDNRGDDPAEVDRDLPAVDLGSERRPLSLALGAHHTCALLEDQTVKCWGDNSEGQLGHEDQVSHGDGSDSDPGMGDNLPPTMLGTAAVVDAIAAGESHTCVLLDGVDPLPNIKCWGWNRHGQLALGHDNSWGDEPEQMGDALPPVPFSYAASALAVGGDFNCVILADVQLSLRCWGDNGAGSLGLEDMYDRGDDPDEVNYYALLAVDLGAGRRAVRVDLGRKHACAILDNGQVKCWGLNQFGQLGLGDTDHRGDGVPTEEMGDELQPLDL